MIKRYSDHAANERTFLAWVRTAIAVMAFGFLIERFDLFLRYIAPQAAQPQAAPRSEAFANWAGLAFIVLGIAMIIIAGMRLAKTAKDIETDIEVASTGARFDLALVVLIGILGASLLLYMSHAVLRTLQDHELCACCRDQCKRDDGHELLAPAHAAGSPTGLRRAS